MNRQQLTILGLVGFILFWKVAKLPKLEDSRLSIIDVK